MRKTIFSIILCLTTIGSFAQFGGGSGTEEDPYRIYTKEHFEEFANEYNSMNYGMFGDFSGIHLRLMNNITDTVKITLHTISPNIETGYNGYFHGGGHSINISPEDPFPALFGKIGQNGYIDSLEIVGTPYCFIAMVSHNYGTIFSCICNLDINLPIYPYGSISGICWLNYGLIESCVNLSDFTNAIDPNTGWVNPYEISGICYWNYNTIRRCSNKGNFSVKQGVLGGITTYNEGIIELCINAGNISSGNPLTDESAFAGISSTTQINSIIRNCINSGNIIFSTGTPVGGMTSDAASTSSESLIENCFNSGKIFGYVGESGISRGGGIAGWLGGTNINNCLNIGNNGGGAIVDTSYNNSLIISSLTNNFYDKQMCLSKGIASEDIPDVAEGKLTTQLTGTSPELQAMLGDGWSYAEGRYPIPLGLENDSMALVAATPVYLHFENEEDYNHVDSVSKNFYITTEFEAIDTIVYPTWESSFERVSFNDNYAELLSVGYEILSVNFGNYSKIINIIIVDTEVSSPEIALNNKISIYPNPATEYLNIELNQYLSDEVQIYDVCGKLLISKVINSNHTQINIADLEQGMYILNVLKSDRKIASLRFVKE